MSDFYTLNQTLTTINITPVLLIKTGGGAGGLILFLKWFGDGTIYKWLGHISKWANRKATTVTITNVFKKIKNNPEFKNFEIGLGKKIKFEIQKDLHVEDLEDGESVLIALDSVKNTPSNVTKSVIQYVSKSLLPKASATLDKKLEKGVTYMVSRGIFVNQKLLAAKDYFECNMLPKEYERDADFEGIMQELESIDDFGLLTRILLQQFYELNKLELDTVNHTRIKIETSRFYKFLHRICTRQEYDDSTPLKFDGEFIKSRVFLVTSSRSAREGGAQKLFEGIQRQNNYDHIYLICPAINKDMKDRKHLPTWEIYNKTLELLMKQPSAFYLGKSSNFEIRNSKKEKFKVGVTYLIRNG